jgi:hypothetical protein
MSCEHNTAKDNSVAVTKCVVDVNERKARQDGEIAGASGFGNSNIASMTINFAPVCLRIAAASPRWSK